MLLCGRKFPKCESQQTRTSARGTVNPVDVLLRRLLALPLRSGHRNFGENFIKGPSNEQQVTFIGRIRCLRASGLWSGRIRGDGDGEAHRADGYNREGGIRPDSRIVDFRRTVARSGHEGGTPCGRAGRGRSRYGPPERDNPEPWSSTSG